MQAVAAPAPSIGTDRVLVLLIQFNDLPGTFSPFSFRTKYFGTASDTLRGYYKEVSYNNLILTGDVYGWYSASQPYAYYGNNQSGQGGVNAYPNNAQRLAEEAIDAAAAAGVNFSLYDNNHDGEVDSLIIVHAGQGAEMLSPANKNYIQSFTGALSAGGGQARNYSGVVIDKFSILPEISYHGSGIIEEIGPVAHEYGHQLGLPDLYDWDKSSSGVGWWDLMSSGVWGGSSIIPARPFHPGTWSKVHLGWITPTVISPANQGQYSLQAIERNAKALKIPANPGVPEEYFLVSYHQKTGYDRSLPGQGLLIWHADDRIWRQNMDEDKGCAGFYPVLSVEQADGLFELEKAINWGNSTDLYPGAAGKRNSFTGATTPNTRNHSCNVSGVEVSSIRQQNSSTMRMNVYANHWKTNDTTPELKVVREKYTPVSGNGDEFMEPGEQWELSLTLLNNGTTAGAVTATIAAVIANVTASKTPVTFPDIMTGQTADQAVPFTITIGPTVPPDERVVLLLIINAANGYQYLNYLNFHLGRPGILYVDDDAGKSTDMYFNLALSHYNYFYHYWNVSALGLPDSSMLSQYQTVVWDTGEVQNTPLSPAAIGSLETYLDAGGHLYLVSPYLLINPSPEAAAFAGNYLHLSSFSDDRFAITNIHGIDDDPISYSASAFNYKLELLYYPEYNRNVSLTPAASAFGSLANDRGHYVTTRYTDPVKSGPRVIFSSFGIENIPRLYLVPFLSQVLNALNYYPGEPFVTAISPLFAQQKSINLVLTVKGLNFTPQTAFSFPRGGVHVTSAQYQSSRQFLLTVNVDYDAPVDYHPIIVQNPGGDPITSDKYLMVIGPPLPNKTPVAVVSQVSQSGIRAQTFILDGSPSYDPDLDALSYKWTRTKGPAVTLIPTNAAAVVSFIPAKSYIGDYQFNLVVSDRWNSSTPVTATVSVYNQVPVGAASPEYQSGLRSDTFIMDGSGSFDPDTDTLTYKWTQTKGPSVALLPGSGAARVSFVPSNVYVGDYQFSFVVSDPWNSAPVQTLTVNIINQPPQAEAGPDQDAALGMRVYLDGRASSDPDHDALTCHWVMETKPPGSAAALDNQASPTPSFMYDVLGDYLISLEVNDGYDTSVKDYVTVRSLPSAGDSDNDGLSNLDEQNIYHTDPLKADTDMDGLSDGQEVLSYHTDPLNPDTDADGLTDGQEVLTWHTDPLKADSDNDQVNDFIEVQSGCMNPRYWDTDRDGLADGYEYSHSQNPCDAADGLADNDGDKISNANEYWNRSRINVPDPPGYGPVNNNRSFWGDSGAGDGLIGPEDLSVMRSLLAGDFSNMASLKFYNVIPTSGNAQDLDSDGVFGPVDFSILRAMISGINVNYAMGMPAALEVAGQPETQVLVGFTAHIWVKVRAQAKDKYMTGAAVVFSVDTGKSNGALSFLGGDGPGIGSPDYQYYRWDQTGNLHPYAYDADPARVTLRVDAAGTIVIRVYSPEVGISGQGRYMPYLEADPIIIHGVE